MECIIPQLTARIRSYGDYAPIEPAGRVFFTAWMLIAVPIVVRLFQTSHASLMYTHSRTRRVSQCKQSAASGRPAKNDVWSA